MKPIRRTLILASASLGVAVRAALGVLGVLGVVGTSQAQSAAKFPMKVAHLESPTQPRHQAFLKVAELVRTRTNGEVDMQLFPAGQLGSGRQIVEGVQFGTIESTMMPVSFIAGFNPSVSILDIPYLFPTDRAKSQQLRQSAFGKAVLESFNSRQLLGRLGSSVSLRMRTRPCGVSRAEQGAHHFRERVNGPILAVVFLPHTIRMTAALWDWN